MKTFKTLDRGKALETFLSLQGDSSIGEIVFHFRVGTHGKNDLKNCHPFDAGNDFYLAHNGMLDIHDEEDKVSDTFLFSKYLKDMSGGWHENQNTVSILETFIAGSKMVLMSPKHTVILNRDDGIEEDGIWYSNGGFRDIQTKYRGKGAYSSFSFRPSLKASDWDEYGLNDLYRELGRAEAVGDDYTCESIEWEIGMLESEREYEREMG